MASGIPYLRNTRNAPGSFSGVLRFLRWWRDELFALIPANLRPYPPSTASYVWVEFEADQVLLFRIRDGRRKEVGQIALSSRDAAARRLAFNALLGKDKHLPIGIAVPPERILRKEVTLPLAAQENLRQVLGFELGRHTPFNADHAYFDFQESAADPKAKVIRVALVVADRRPVDTGISLLREWGVVPQAVVPADQLLQEARYVNLLPASLRPGMPPRRKLAYAAMALVTVLLLGAVMAIPLWQKREVVIGLDRVAAAERQKADAVNTLQQRLAQAQHEYRYLLDLKLKQPAKVAVLEEVSRLLPDDAWLSNLQVKGDDVVLNGEAKSATDLIRIMGESSLLEDAAFTSPVVKERNDLERFQIGAKIRNASPSDTALTKPSSQQQPPQKPAGGVERPSGSTQELGAEKGNKG